MMHRRLRALRTAGMAALFLFGSAGAVLAQPDARPAFLLGAGDTIRLTVFDRPNLSGDALIGPDGIASWPLLGDIPAAGLGLAEVRAALADAIGRVLDHAPDVGVQVVGYRPIYVVGQVADPGEHAFMPGLSVLQAFAKAGGMPTLAGSLAGRTGDQTTAVLSARERLRGALAQERDLLVRRAHLRALLSGEHTLTLPPALAQAAPGDGDAIDPAGRYEALLQAELPYWEVARSAAQRHDALLAAQIEALTKEGEAIDKQLEMVESEVGRMQALRNQGLTTNARMLSLRQIEADLEADTYRRDAALSRAERDRLRATDDVRLNETEWRTERLKELAEVEGDLMQTDVEIQSARERLAALGAVGAVAGNEGTADPAALPGFVVMRRGPTGVMETLAAQPGDLLKPGDVLRVDPPPMPEGPVASSATGAQVRADGVAF
jgi:protein involved in polysaccharide export with SLBB domain